MAKLWEKDLRYSILRLWCDCNTRRSYCRTTVQGKLPRKGAVIIAPNHTNTLMDALVVLRTRKGPTAFGARADVFKKPAIARFLRLIRIVPMARSRDGGRAVLQNWETFHEVDEVLEHGVPFCLFSEGRHRPKHSLLPIQKGIARIAFASAEKRQTYVVPTGIEYGDYFHYRTTCDIRSMSTPSCASMRTVPKPRPSRLSGTWSMTGSLRKSSLSRMTGITRHVSRKSNPRTRQTSPWRSSCHPFSW